METHIEIPKKEKEMLVYIQSLFNKPVYIVGGFVRNIIIGEPINDYDFCTSLTTEEIKEQLKGKHRAYLIGEKFGTIGFKVGGEMIEITTFRGESYEDGSRHPKVEFVKDIVQDLSRRDFSINAIAIRCDNFKLIDPFKGQKDLSNRILRTVGNSKIRFKEDPLRILRAIRFACRFDLIIEPKTLDRIVKMSPKLLEISKERWVQEIDKILLDDNVGFGLQRMWSYGIFKYTIPELSLQHNYEQNSKYHDFALDVHTIKVVEAAQKAGEPIEVLWACLLHDVAKPFVRTERINNDDEVIVNYINHEILGAEMADKIATHLKWSNSRRATVVNLVKNHLNDDCILRRYDNEGKLLLPNN